MGPSEYADRTTAPVSEVDGLVAALHRIADAIILLAQATAGEFEQDDDHDGISRPTDISGRPI